VHDNFDGVLMSLRRCVDMNYGVLTSTTSYADRKRVACKRTRIYILVSYKPFVFCTAFTLCLVCSKNSILSGWGKFIMYYVSGDLLPGLKIRLAQPN
jgi:hypothetical protein